MGVARISHFARDVDVGAVVGRKQQLRSELAVNATVAATEVELPFCSTRNRNFGRLNCTLLHGGAELQCFSICSNTFVCQVLQLASMLRDAITLPVALPDDVPLYCNS